MFYVKHAFSLLNEPCAVIVWGAIREKWKRQNCATEKFGKIDLALFISDLQILRIILLS